MNGTFAEYATSTAFLVQLSKNQCNALLRVSAVTFDTLVQVSTLQSLEARGLVFWKRDHLGRAIDFGGLTRAGELMVELLKEAGMTIESTNSVGMLKRLAREAA
jgi:microsomal dipeptidase-like Zn-dependent dipeptidase